jgi:hypothetical protein
MQTYNQNFLLSNNGTRAGWVLAAAEIGGEEPVKFIK